MGSTTSEALPAGLDSESSEKSAPEDAINLHVLSPASEVAGGRITFPNIPLDTKLSQLKCRIQDAIPSAEVSPEKQRLIYRGRPLLKMDVSLRQFLQQTIDQSASDRSTYTIHMVITGSTDRSSKTNSASSSLGHVAQHQTGQDVPPQVTPRPSSAPSPYHYPPQHHFRPQRQEQQPPPPITAQARAAQSALQTSANHIPHPTSAATSMQSQGQPMTPASTQNQTHASNPHPSHPSLGLPTAPAFSNAFQFVQPQPQRIPANQSANHRVLLGNGANGQQSWRVGATTTRTNETVDTDRQRTQVVVNETTFHLPSQPASAPNFVPPIGQTARAASIPRTSARSHLTAASANSTPPPGSNESSTQPPSEFPNVAGGPQEAPPNDLGSFVPPEIAYRPTLPLDASISSSTLDSNDNTASTTAFLVSNPLGPQALVFAPGHGLFSNARVVGQAMAHSPRPRLRPNFYPATAGQGRPQQPPTTPLVAVANHDLNDATTNAAHPQGAPSEQRQILPQAPQANVIPRARGGGVNANQRRPENELVYAIVSRAWTFAKLYLIVFMFTEPRSWFRWISLFCAVLVSVAPTTTIPQEFLRRMRTRFDLFLTPDRLPARPVRRRGNRGTAARTASGQAHANNSPNTATSSTSTDTDSSRTRRRRIRQPEPDPAATAARLTREHHHRRQRQYQQQQSNTFYNSVRRAEQAAGLFFASLIPSVGERHVRLREEARRERERLLREDDDDEEDEEEEEGEGEEEEERREKGERGGNEEEAVATATATAAGQDAEEREEKKGKNVTHK